jgi:UPF0716 protein FxsA
MVFLGLLVWAFAEIYVFVEVARAISFPLALLLLVGTSVIGGSVLRREGRRAWSRIRQTIAAGRTPAAEITNGSLVVLGAALLLVPGFIGDAIGLLILIPGSRHALGWAIRMRLRRRLRVPGTASRRASRGRVIDGEATEKKPPRIEKER